MKEFIQKLDSVPKRVLLGVNAAATLTLGAGPSLMLYFVQFPSEVVADMRWLTVGLLVCACIAVPPGIIGTLSRRSERVMFSIQALGVFALAMLLLVWAVSVLIHGTPRKVGFSWTPGILSALVGYGVYLLRRSFFEQFIEQSRVAFYAHFGAAVAVVPVEVGIMFRIIFDFMHRHAAA